MPRARRAALVGHLAVGELATPPASGAGDRRFDSCQPDSSRRRPSRKGRDMEEEAVEPLLSFVYILPNEWGRSSESRVLACQARGRRFESGRPRPESRLEAAKPPREVPTRGDRGVVGSIRGCDPRGAGSSPAGHPFARALSTRRAHPAVIRAPRAVVVRLHPPAPRRTETRRGLARGRSSGGGAPRLHRGGAGSIPAVSTRQGLRSVNGSTRPLYGRGAGSTPAGGSWVDQEPMV